MEKRDCCELLERPVKGCPTDLPSGREWIVATWQLDGREDPVHDVQELCAGFRNLPFIQAAAAT
jgi:hypothetical protein